MTTKTQQALALVDQGVAPYAAAKQVGVASSAVYVALAQRKALQRGRCRCCGGPVDETGEAIESKARSEKG